MESAKGPVYEEWMPTPVGYVGRSYKVTGSDTTIFEKVVLKKDAQGIYYVPTTQNQNNRQPVTFTLVQREKNRFVFENKAHDFPQRVIYNIVNHDSIAARIEGVQNGNERSEDYFYRRVK